MPAVPVALAEIEERLEEIRYRLNRRSLSSILAPMVGVALVLCALLVWSASRATPQGFSISLYATLAAIAVLAAWSASLLWRRWLSLRDAARLADDRAGMQERVTTALWLAHSPVQPALTPVLVADTIERRKAWQVSAIVPRRFPFELGFPLAGVAALIAALLLAPNLPPGPGVVAQTAKPPHPIEKQEKAPAPEPQQASQGDDDPLLDAPAERQEAERVMDVGTSGESGSRPGAKMSEQVRNAIREAIKRFDGNAAKTDVARAELGRSGRIDVVGAKANPDPQRDAHQAPGIEPEQPAEGENAADAEGATAGERSSDNGRESGRPRAGDDKAEKGRRGPGGAQDEHAENKGGGANPARDPQATGNQAKGADGNESDKPASNGQKADRPPPNGKQNDAAKGSRDNAAEGAGKQQGGARAAAGGNSDADGLFAAKGAAGTQLGGTQGSGTFKLTLGSFLSSGPSHEQKPQNRDRAPSQNSRAAVTEPPSLNPNQAADDVLRRADIPPEYEEIVRRIYSARPSR